MEHAYEQQIRWVAAWALQRAQPKQFLGNLGHTRTPGAVVAPQNTKAQIGGGDGSKSSS